MSKMTKEEVYNQAKAKATELMLFCNENNIECMSVIKPRGSNEFNMSNTYCGHDMLDILIGIGTGRY